MLQALKRLTRNLPGIRNLVSDRDRLLEQRDQLQAEGLRLYEERALLQAEREQLLKARERLQSQRDTLSAERDRLLDEIATLRKAAGFVEPGHFYSPIPPLKQIRADADRIFAAPPRQLEGIPMDEEGQLRLLEALRPFHDDMPFSAHEQEGFRYYFENPAYSWSDGILLHGMMRHLRPRRIIEVGSGFSSCMMLDTNERYFDGQIEMTFIEPHPDLLESLIREADRDHSTILSERLQDIDPALFDVLEANDILFIDSTHVSRIDSDVNRILFDILPRLAPGVYVHFHDIFWPFEYPEVWVMEGRAWNEAYVLRAFLQFNPAFRVVLMNTFMERFHRPFLERKLPLCLKGRSGSLWLRREPTAALP